VKTTLKSRKSVVNKASAIKFVKALFSSDLSENLAYIKSNFVVISKTTAHLKAVGEEMKDALDPVKSAECAVEQACGKAAESVRNKFKKELEHNDGFLTMCKINGILGGNRPNTR
jgi:asparagine synthetase A